MRAIRALQHQSSLGAQQKSDQASAAVRRRPSQIPPPVERDRINTATQPPAMASSGLQQLKSRRSLPTMGRNTPPPSSRTIGVRRGRAASCDRPCDRPSPRSTSWPRYQSPLPFGGNIVITPVSLVPGILGRRQRSNSPSAGTSVRPHQRLRFTITEDIQNQRALGPRGGIPVFQGHRPSLSESAPTLSESIASARAWSNRAEARAAGP